MLASQKQDAMKAAFKDWIFKDQQRRERLVRVYNERFNSIRPREYDGSHLTFPGMNPEIELRPHQKNAIAMKNKNTFLPWAMRHMIYLKRRLWISELYSR